MTHKDVSRCPNGEQGFLVSWQPAVHSFSPSIHFFDCSEPETRSLSRVLPRVEDRLHPRQAEFSCQAPCSTTCATSGIQYNADECDELSNWMWQRNAQYPVNAHQKVVLTWGTCMYAFTNDMSSNVTWCDAQWAQIGNYIARPCLAQSGTGGTCAGRGFLVEVLSNDGSTNNTPIPYTATPASSNTFISSTIPSSTYTEVPIPLMTTISPTDTSTNDSFQYGTSNVPVVPVVFGVLGGVGFLAILLAFVCLARLRAERGNMPLASEDVHEMGPKPAEVSYSMKQKVSRHDFSSHGSSQPATLPRPASPNTGSRGPTRLSTYTIEFDPFRSLRRALSGRSRRQPSPATAL